MNTLFFLRAKFFREKPATSRKHSSNKMGVLRIFFETVIDRTFRESSEKDPAEDSLLCLDVRADHAKLYEISDRLWEELKPTRREIEFLRHFENSHIAGIYLERDKLISKARQSQSLSNLVIESANQMTQPETASTDPALLTLRVDAVKFPTHLFQIERRTLLELLDFFRDEYSIVEGQSR